MARSFNVTGSCNPQFHYMVNIQDKLAQIKELVDAGAYFTINRARQYGKTTTLTALTKYLMKEYVVISLDFQEISDRDFSDEETFANSFVDVFLEALKDNGNIESFFQGQVIKELEDSLAESKITGLRVLFSHLKKLCEQSSMPIVLIIDEVDSATNNQVFLDFLAQLRAGYLARANRNKPAFQSVILAGVYDVKNIKRKFRSDEAHKTNSPWNIATDFLVNMSFSRDGIAGMLKEYEADHHTGMDIALMVGLIYDYTSGYPFLVSILCKLIDERIAGTEQFCDKKAAWTKDGFLEAVKLLLSDRNTLFESLMGKLLDYPELEKKIQSILFGGEKIVFSPFDSAIDMALMFGFVKNEKGNVVIANRIFEMLLYDYFLTAGDAQNNEIFKTASQSKTQFICNGHLNMDLILEKYVEHFDSIYGDHAEPFSEEEGRRRFLLYLRPIINGTGNYYIEAETRNERRMDVVVDYHGEQFIIELKIWRGNAYNERGEKQIADYLDYFKLKKGYMLSYNFNQKKEIGVKRICYGERVLVEAVV